jgi:hypothetical protein
MEKTFICTLHKQHDCNYRQYGYECALKTRSEFAIATCQFRRELSVLAAAGQGESPENVVQQPQPEKNAGTMEAEIKEIF